MTASGKALTRIFVVDLSTTKVVCDQLVEPPSPLPIISLRKFVNDLSGLFPFPYSDKSFGDLAGSFT